MTEEKEAKDFVEEVKSAIMLDISKRILLKHANKDYVEGYVDGAKFSVDLVVSMLKEAIEKRSDAVSKPKGFIS